MFANEPTDEQRRKKKERDELLSACTKFVGGHGRPDAADELAELAAFARDAGTRDHYGTGEAIHALETRVAKLLGYEKAAFMPSGVMAQLCALRVWSERAGCANVAFHASAHLEQNEQRAYEKLHGLHAAMIGGRLAVPTARDLRDHPERLAALLLELPMRRLGGLAPLWDELEALKAAAREKSVRLHLDGARLWEVQPFYGRPHDEICRGFDSTYISFYKGLGAMCGAMLCGPADFLREARVWQRRMGGNLYQLHPFVLSAALALEQRLGKFDRYFARAREAAREIAAIPGARVQPAEPRSCLFHIHLDAPVAALETARDTLARERGIWVAWAFQEAEVPGWSFTEVTIGDAALDLAPGEIGEAFARLLALARG